MWRELDLRGLLDGGESVSEINFVFDNCPGQNKNRMVLRMLPVLINLGICRTARAFFLIKGHTKNDCDRMYNLLKKEYRKSNCYTPGHWYNFLETANDAITITRAKGYFFDWDNWEDKYMINKVAGCSKNHVFTCSENDPDRIHMCRAQGMPLFVVALLLNHDLT